MTPVVMVISICTVLAGLVVLFRGAAGRDINLEADILPTADRELRDRLHPPERNTRRLMAIGGVLMVVGIALGVSWTALAV